MGRLIDIDKVRVTTAAAEKKNKEEEHKKKHEDDLVSEKKNDDLARAHIKSLPEKIEAAARKGQWNIYIDFPDRDFFGAIIKIEKWCIKNCFAARRSDAEDPNDSSKIVRLTISWSK